MAYNNICLIQELQDPDGKNWVVNKIPTNDHCNTVSYPEICVDEPLAGLDNTSVSGMWQIFSFLNMSSGFTVNGRRHLTDYWSRLCANNVESEPLCHVFKPDLESLRSESDWSEMVVRFCLTMIL